MILTSFWEELRHSHSFVVGNILDSTVALNRNLEFQCDFFCDTYLAVTQSRRSGHLRQLVTRERMTHHQPITFLYLQEFRINQVQRKQIAQRLTQKGLTAWFACQNAFVVVTHHDGTTRELCLGMRGQLKFIAIVSINVGGRFNAPFI